ncbi:cyclohexanone monooxygenase [Sphingomonas jinjuensis]|uniref:Cyclohexanone monooxygenase n=1 Tax=Sphingomonas jinjuensis TaxID=535907 RepID=A0A840FP65_9SPHN|nr:NAD(P)/FAD-dependent oxidoreductase [Sphingomonas jinjuensis]MBB4155075.1 cyclohexanone monooxygenase [Sphingomonas jinjuensis]
MADEYDVVIVGAGFAGLYMLYRVRQLGLKAHVVERAGDVGGTWYWNRYVGARCDVESVDYSYSFSDELQQEWQWTERFPAQPEILRYIQHVADRFDLRRDISFNTEVRSAHFDDSRSRWVLTTEDSRTLIGRYCVMATGGLSTPARPDFAGLDTFGGDWYQTSLWPHEGVDFSGKRVGVIGTGSSGIQCIPEIAKQAAHLTVFQRTPNFTLPARNAPLEPDALAEFKRGYAEHRAAARKTKGGIKTRSAGGSALAVSAEQRKAAFDEHWARGGNGITSLFDDLMVDEGANQLVADYVRDQIKSIVKDPDVAALLSPTDHPLGAKRICLDTGYYDTYNRDNVELVNLRARPIASIDENGIVLSEGRVDLDVIVFATGFDALTGALLAMDIRGSRGTPLAEAWSSGPRTYLGLTVAGFPNMFTLAGAGTPAPLTNVVASIEQQVDWVSDCLAWMKEHGIARVEADGAAQDAWVEHVFAAAEKTLMMRASSWYLGANIPGKPRVFMPYVGGLDGFDAILQDVAHDGYRGLAMTLLAVADGAVAS